MLDVVEKYNKVAKEFAAKYNVDSPHIISIIASVMMTRDGVGLTGGSFVQSVVDNDLYGTISRADYECEANLKVITSANRFAHIN